MRNLNQLYIRQHLAELTDNILHPMRYQDLVFYCNLQLVHNRQIFVNEENHISLNKLVSDFMLQYNISEDQQNYISESVQKWFSNYPYKHKYLLV